MADTLESQTIGIKLAPYNPTNFDCVDLALSLFDFSSAACVKLYDLGCGDARLLIQACKMLESVVCVGVEYDQLIVDKALQAIESACISENKVSIHHFSFFHALTCGNCTDKDIS